MMDSTGYPLVMTNSLLLKMAIEIVDLPMKNGDFPYLGIGKQGPLTQLACHQKKTGKAPLP